MNFCGSRTRRCGRRCRTAGSSTRTKAGASRTPSTRTRARRSGRTRRTIFIGRSSSGSDDSGGRSCPTGAGTSGAGVVGLHLDGRAGAGRRRRDAVHPDAAAQAGAGRRRRGAAPPAVGARRRPGAAPAGARRLPAATAPWRTTPLAVSTKTGGAPVPVASKARPRAPRPRRAWRPPVAVAARTPAAVAVAAAHEAVTVATTAAPSTTPRRRLHTFQGPVRVRVGGALPRRRSPSPSLSESMDTTQSVQKPVVSRPV